MEKLKQPLLEWYRCNARNLPWRRNCDPYQIWVSEIMLQQTRVGAVLAYYRRFMRALPTVQDLAEVPEEQLMKLWEGLGYYSRARNLQKTAKIIVEQYGGVFPKTYEELLTLPGIGEYTAGAIASAAYGLRVPAVDGNVMRVLSRILDDERDISDLKLKKVYAQYITAILPHTLEEMRIFNQALMELGATVCVPNGAPRCEICPVVHLCRAAANGTTLQRPVKAPKKQRRIEQKTVFVLLREGAVALRKRSAESLLAGLWEFPNTDGVLEEKAVYDHLAGLGLTVTDWKKQLTAKHIFTHVEWHMTGYVLQVTGDMEDVLWADREQFAACAIPSAFAKFTKEAEAAFK